ncbi:FAD-binding oxidoreductase [Sinosporangium siamense]|uniref:Oxidoreductase n=1 Tax=Sinosporangium siamense TaxID=1367973 RepID=A0A919RHI2_9ACTN|nr:FAD-binding oxidoreductase [Sinosporangium siamense]GII93985.1 oxidoreductase [Sinosporangium siamense]
MNDKSQRLAARSHGPVYAPGDKEYDGERTGFQLLDPHRPAVIVAATGAGDVRSAVEFAAETRTPLAVQAAGHGHAAPGTGMLISTRRMSAVRVDPRARTAWVEAGATWRHVVEAAAPYGMAPLSGSFPGLGAVPYTLGGGVGLLARRFGFAADHVRRLDVVTLDGRLREVTAAAEPDLFWALRGGGGDFGVVTGMEIDLFPVARIYGGTLFFDAGRVPDVLDGWRRWTADVPEGMTSGVTALPYPDLPVLPAPLRGRHVAQIHVCYAGPAEEGRDLVEPLRSLGPVLLDTLRDLPYAESGKVFDEPDRPHAYRSRNLLVSDLRPQALADLTKAAGPSAPVMTVVGLRHLGGALAREPHVANAVGHRGAAYAVTTLSPVESGEEEKVGETHRDALAPFAGEALGRSLNFSFGALGGDEIRSAFAPGDYDRLVKLKAEHDPHGLLQANHRIPPAL